MRPYNFKQALRAVAPEPHHAAEAFATEGVSEVVEQRAGTARHHVPLPAPPREIVHLRDVVRRIAGIRNDGLAGRIELHPAFFCQPAVSLRVVVERGAGVRRRDGELQGVRVQTQREIDAAARALSRFARKPHEEIGMGLNAELAAIANGPRDVFGFLVFRNLAQDFWIAALHAKLDRAAPGPRHRFDHVAIDHGVAHATEGNAEAPRGIFLAERQNVLAIDRNCVVVEVNFVWAVALDERLYFVAHALRVRRR